MRFPFFRNRDSVKNGILISIRRTGDGFHPGLFSNVAQQLQDSAAADLSPAACKMHKKAYNFGMWYTSGTLGQNKSLEPQF